MTEIALMFSGLHDGVILTKDFPLCFNTYNKTDSLFHQEHNNSAWYWYFTMTTYLSLSLDHFPASVQR
jgi:hypothetical protein